MSPDAGSPGLRRGIRSGNLGHCTAPLRRVLCTLWRRVCVRACFRAQSYSSGAARRRGIRVPGGCRVTREGWGGPPTPHLGHFQWAFRGRCSHPGTPACCRLSGLDHSPPQKETLCRGCLEANCWVDWQAAQMKEKPTRMSSLPPSLSPLLSGHQAPAPTHPASSAPLRPSRPRGPGTGAT